MREYIVGTISGTTIINLIRGVGNSTAQAHLSGAIVEQVVDQTTINDIITGILNQHNQDGTHKAITATSVTSSGAINASGVSSLQDASVALSTYRKEYFFDYVASGGVWSGDSYGSTLNASMTAIVCYINGQRLSVGAVTARAFTASKDTYIDILNTAGVGSVVYTEVANNAASPALAANSIRIGIIVSGASNILNAGSVNQGQETMVLPIASSYPYAVTDSLGNLICPRDPNRKTLGMGIRTTNAGPVPTAVGTDIQVQARVIIPAGRKIKITAKVRGLVSNNAPKYQGVNIWDGTVGSGTKLDESYNIISTSAQGSSVVAIYEGTPSPNASTPTSKTYNFGLVSDADGTTTVQSIAAANYPTIILVELA